MHFVSIDKLDRFHPFLDLSFLFLSSWHFFPVILGPGFTNRLVPVEVFHSALFRTVLGRATRVASVSVETQFETLFTELGVLGRPTVLHHRLFLPQEGRPHSLYVFPSYPSANW